MKVRRLAGCGAPRLHSLMESSHEDDRNRSRWVVFQAREQHYMGEGRRRTQDEASCLPLPCGIQPSTAEGGRLAAPTETSLCWPIVQHCDPDDRVVAAGLQVHHLAHMMLTNPYADCPHRPPCLQPTPIASFLSSAHCSPPHACVACRVEPPSAPAQGPPAAMPCHHAHPCVPPTPRAPGPPPRAATSTPTSCRLSRFPRAHVYPKPTPYSPLIHCTTTHLVPVLLEAPHWVGGGR